MLTPQIWYIEYYSRGMKIGVSKPSLFPIAYMVMSTVRWNQDEFLMAKQRVDGGARRNTGYNSPHIDTEYSDNRILHIEVVW